MKNLIMIALLGCTSLCTRAQSSKPVLQPDSLIKIIYEGRHQLFTIGGRLVPFDDVKAKMLGYAPSAVEFNMAKTNYTWSFISFGASAVTSAAALIAFKNTDKEAGATINYSNATIVYQQHNRTGAYVLTGAATAFLFSSFFNMIKAAQHGKKALKVYNERFGGE
jgi:hypothetical protein